MTIFTGQKTHKIKILVNTIHIYSSYGVPFIGILTREIRRIRDYRCMKYRIKSVYIHPKYIYLKKKNCYTELNCIPNTNIICINI